MLGDPLHGFNHFQAFKQFNVNVACVADETDNGLIIASRNVGSQALYRKPFGQIFQLFIGC